MMMYRILIAFLLATVFGWTPFAQEPTVEELTAAFSAKVLATAIFVSGRDQAEALQNSVIPFVAEVGQDPGAISGIDVDRDAGTVTVTVNNLARTAQYFGDQGCVIIPRGEYGVHFKPVAITKHTPDPETTPWPMGDAPSDGQPADVDTAAIDTALDLVFAPENHTAAFVVVHEGHIIAERYGEGANQNTQHESWSMGKSLTAMLYGRLVNDEGRFDPFKPASFPEWQQPDDPRKKIQIADLFRMSSGLKFSSRGDPESTWDHAHPDHSLVYSGAINVFEFSATRPLEHKPNTVGRYRNCDPLLIGLLIKQRVDAQGENYLAWPQKVLFDKLGIRNITLEPDPYGNFVMTGFEYGSARDWARLGMLMLQDGVWQGERLLPEGFVEFVTTPAPAWQRPEYGGLFWLNRLGRWPLPESAYRMAGHGSQYVIVVPTHDLVIVRMGHLRGGRNIDAALDSALEKIIEALER